MRDSSSDQSKLFQTVDRHLGKVLEDEVLEWGSAPERQRFAEDGGRVLIPTVAE